MGRSKCRETVWAAAAAQAETKVYWTGSVVVEVGEMTDRNSIGHIDVPDLQGVQ